MVILQQKEIETSVSKEALNIDGLGKKVIEQFWDLNLLKEPADIFNLDFKRLSNLRVGENFR